MKHLRVIIKALGPLSFPRRKPGTQFRESLDYISGSALFGALGQAASQSGQFNAAQFRDLRCHNAYAAYPKDSEQDNSWIRPIPATAQGEKGSKDMHDTLIERLCWEKQQPPAIIYSPTDTAGRPWEARGGFYTIQDKKPVRRDPPEQRVITRAGINRKRGTSQDNILFSPLVLNEVTYLPNEQDPQPTQFVGSIVAPDGFAADELLSSIEWIGAHQSTGHGHVEITCTTVAEWPCNTKTELSEWQHTPPQPSGKQKEYLLKRIEQLTKACHDQGRIYEQLGGQKLDITGHIFTINLLSDTILLEHGWQPTMVLTAEMLEEMTKKTEEMTGIKAKLLRSFASYDYAGGWHALWQRPKESHVITRKGSLYVFEIDKKLELNDKDLEKLYQLQLQGIGERVQEGYGQIRICDEFHIIERQG